jgi:dCMP deaminase
MSELTPLDYKFLKEIDKLEPNTHCLRAQIACMIVIGEKVLVQHTNDWLDKYNCTKIGCIRDMMQVPSGHRREICYGICAEQWCVAEAARKGISLEGSTLYCTKHPCRICASLIAVAGIKRVVYQEGYPEVLPNFDILKSRNIEVVPAPETEFKSKKISKNHTV